MAVQTQLYMHLFYAKQIKFVVPAHRYMIIYVRYDCSWYRSSEHVQRSTHTRAHCYERYRPLVYEAGIYMKHSRVNCSFICVYVCVMFARSFVCNDVAVSLQHELRHNIGIHYICICVYEFVSMLQLGRFSDTHEIDIFVMNSWFSSAFVTHIWNNNTRNIYIYINIWIYRIQYIWEKWTERKEKPKEIFRQKLLSNFMTFMREKTKKQPLLAILWQIKMFFWRYQIYPFFPSQKWITFSFRTCHMNIQLLMKKFCYWIIFY